MRDRPEIVCVLMAVLALPGTIGLLGEPPGRNILDAMFDDLVRGLASDDAEQRDAAEKAILAAQLSLCTRLIEMIGPENRGRYDIQSRIAAARLLGRLRCKAASKALAVGLGEPAEPFVLSGGATNFPEECTGALIEIGMPAMRALIDGLQRDEKPAGWQGCLAVIGSVLGRKDDVVYLISRLSQESKDDRVKARLRDALQVVEKWVESERRLY